MICDQSELEQDKTPIIALTKHLSPLKYIEYIVNAVEVYHRESVCASHPVDSILNVSKKCLDVNGIN